MARLNFRPDITLSNALVAFGDSGRVYTIVMGDGFYQVQVAGEDGLIRQTPCGSLSSAWKTAEQQESNVSRWFSDEELLREIAVSACSGGIPEIEEIDSVPGERTRAKITMKNGQVFFLRIKERS